MRIRSKYNEIPVQNDATKNDCIWNIPVGTMYRICIESEFHFLNRYANA